MTKTNEQEASAQRKRRTLTGIVVSDKMDKTVVVQVTRRYKHPRYRKYIQERLRYKAHDENGDAKMGDQVRIIESRPLSKEKRWRLQEVVERAPIL